MATAKDNVALIRKGFKAFNKADLTTLTGILASDCVHHMPGQNRFSGDHKGRDAVLGMYGELGELTGGTFRAEPRGRVCDRPLGCRDLPGPRDPGEQDAGRAALSRV